MSIGSMIPKRVVFQIADVHKPLLYITACSDLGYDCLIRCFPSQEEDTVVFHFLGDFYRGLIFNMFLFLFSYVNRV